MKKALSIALFISFVITIMVPVTGIYVHKLAAAIFLFLSIFHTMIHRKKLNPKRRLLLALLIVSFASGLFGMILDHFSLVLRIHRGISIVLVFFLAIHIFVFHKKISERN